MTFTPELLRLIGSPFADLTRRNALADISSSFEELRACATKNRIVLLFLENVHETQKAEVSTRLKDEFEKYESMLFSVSEASNILSKRRINHAVYKTVRPYRSATVDIDILIFGDHSHHVKAYQTMEDHGYELVVHGPRSTTLMDTHTKIGIDLYQQVAVSNIVYLDKKNLEAYTTTIQLPNNKEIKNLRPEADLLCIVAHSILKEQMYTLSEYYTFINYLKVMSIDELITLAQQNNLTSALRTHATITAFLHKTAHGNIPKVLDRIPRHLGNDDFEITRLATNGLETPHKYHPITIGKSLLEIAKGRETRRSIAAQFRQMTRPKFTKTFLKALFKHVTRETY